VPLVTEDRKLQRALPEQTLSMAAFTGSVPKGGAGE
jgi:hypothetical protein